MSEVGNEVTLGQGGFTTDVILTFPSSLFFLFFVLLCVVCVCVWSLGPRVFVFFFFAPMAPNNSASCNASCLPRLRQST